MDMVLVSQQRVLSILAQAISKFCSRQTLVELAGLTALVCLFRRCQEHGLAPAQPRLSPGHSSVDGTQRSFLLCTGSPMVMEDMCRLPNIRTAQ